MGNQSITGVFLGAEITTPRAQAMIGAPRRRRRRGPPARRGRPHVPARRGRRRARLPREPPSRRPRGPHPLSHLRTGVSRVRIRRSSSRRFGMEVGQDLVRVVRRARPRSSAARTSRARARPTARRVGPRSSRNASASAGASPTGTVTSASPNAPADGRRGRGHDGPAGRRALEHLVGNDARGLVARAEHAEADRRVRDLVRAARPRASASTNSMFVSPSSRGELLRIGRVPARRRRAGTSGRRRRAARPRARPSRIRAAGCT